VLNVKKDLSTRTTVIAHKPLCLQTDDNNKDKGRPLIYNVIRIRIKNKNFLLPIKVPQGANNLIQ